MRDNKIIAKLFIAYFMRFTCVVSVSITTGNEKYNSKPNTVDKTLFH
jgi:hypothetical protein